MKREVKLKNFMIIMIVLVTLEIFLLIIFGRENELIYNSEYCQNAVCNEDESLCYAYELDSEGNTVVVWRGSCQSGN